MNRRIIAAVAVSVLFAVPMAVCRADQPTKESLIAAWERVQSTDSHTKAFQKTSEGHYRFRTDWFPYDGELVVLNAVVAPLAEGLDQDWAKMPTGTVEVDLPGLTQEQREKLSNGIEYWERTNTLHYDPKTQRWMTPAEYRTRMMAEAQRASRPWSWLGLLSGYGLPIVLLMFWLFVWGATTRRSKSVLAESLRMSQRSLENQTRMIELLEQTVALLEKRSGG
jgi:hypothetical protein